MREIFVVVVSWPEVVVAAVVKTAVDVEVADAVDDDDVELLQTNAPVDAFTTDFTVPGAQPHTVFCTASDEALANVIFAACHV